MARRYQVKPRFWLTLSVTAVLVFSVSFLVTRARLEAQAVRVQERIAERDQIVREIGELENEIDFVQTDEYVERAARDELGLIMPGEVRYVNAAGEGQ